MHLSISALVLTLCLDEMKDFCRDMSGQFSIPEHGLPIHPLYLVQKREKTGVTGNAGRMSI